MKKALSLIIALIMIAFTAFTVFAETEATYTITLDTYKEKYRIGDDVFLNAKLENIVSETGFIAFEIIIEYDPELLKAIKGDNDEIAETNLPESWLENGERHE